MDGRSCTGRGRKCYPGEGWVHIRTPSCPAHGTLQLTHIVGFPQSLVSQVGLSTGQTILISDSERGGSQAVPLSLQAPLGPPAPGRSFSPRKRGLPTVESPAHTRHAEFPKPPLGGPANSYPTDWLAGWGCPPPPPQQ